MIWPMRIFDDQMLWVFGRTAVEACHAEFGYSELEAKPSLKMDFLYIS